MKAHFLILPFVILFLLSCKKGPIPEIPPAADTHVLVKPLDTEKKSGRARLQIKPFCYNDFNTAYLNYLNLKNGGC